MNTSTCVCEHPHGAHNLVGHCLRCACNAFRRLVECGNCFEPIVLDASVDGAICSACGTKVSSDGA